MFVTERQSLLACVEPLLPLVGREAVAAITVEGGGHGGYLRVW